MTTTTSSFKGDKLYSLYVSILRRNLGVTILYSILLLVFFPLQYILTASSAVQPGGPNESVFFMGNGGLYTGVSVIAFPALMTAIPVLYTMLQYSYLHQRKSTDLYHALPIRREKLLLVNYAAGATQVLAPMLLSYLFLLAAGLAFGFPSFSVLGLFEDLFIYTASVLAVLAIATLVSVSCGTVFDSFIYNCAVLVGLPIALDLMNTHVELILFGYISPEWLVHRWTASPATLMLAVEHSLGRKVSLQVPAPQVSGVYPWASALWLALGAFILWLAARTYRRRRSELAGTTGYDNPLTRLCKLGGALVGGIYFSDLMSSAANQYRNVLMGTLAALAGGALSYCVIECVMARGFKTLRSCTALIAAGTVLPALFVLAVGTGGLGYESRIPNVETVESITLEYSGRYDFTRYNLDALRAMMEKEHPAVLKERGKISYVGDVTLNSDEAKEKIIALHQAVLRGRQNQQDAVAGAYFVVRYHLKNGSAVKRRYGPLDPQANEIYNSLNGLEEVKRQTHPIFTMNAADVRELTLMNRLMCGITPVTLSEDQTQKLIEALREDMLAESFEQMKASAPLGYLVCSPRRGAGYIQSNYYKPGFVLPSGSAAFEDCYVLLTAAYQRTLALLNEYGYKGFEQIRYENIESLYVSLDGFTGRDYVMFVQGPDNFTRDSYKENNYYRSIDNGSTRIASPSDIRTLTDAVSYDLGRAVTQLHFTEQDQADFDGWNSSATVTVRIATHDNSNVVTTFYIDPREVPDNILRKLKEDFNRTYTFGTVDGVDIFERVLDRIHDARSGGELQTAVLAAQVFLSE